MASTHTSQKGQTLVSLLVFSVLAIAVASAATVIMINTAQATHITESRTRVSLAAESGVENALLRLIRNPNYTGETLLLDDSTIEIVVTGTNVKTITSEAQTGSYLYTIRATAEYVNNRLTVTSWDTVY